MRAYPTATVRACNTAADIGFGCLTNVTGTPSNAGFGVRIPAAP